MTPEDVAYLRAKHVSAPVRNEIAVWPADRITDDHTVEDRIRNAVRAEREACAKLVDQFTARMGEIMASLVNQESWQWALNEMTDEVNRQFREMQAIPYAISTVMRGRQP